MDDAAYQAYLNNIQTIAANQATQPTQQPQQSQPAAAPAHQPSWWQKLLPAAGGIGGGILGTLIAGPVGGIAGAALGGAAGQAGENATEGKAVLQGNDLTSGVENGVGQAVGLGIGKAVGAVGGGLASAGAKGTAKLADEAAVQQVGQDAGMKNLIYGEAMGNAANKNMLRNGFQTTLDNAQALGVNPLDQNAPRLMSQIGHAQTGGDVDGKGFLNDTVDNLLANHGGTVNMAGVKQADGSVVDSLQSELEGAIQRQNAMGKNLGDLTETVAGSGKKLVPANNPAQQLVKTLGAMSPKLQTSTMGGELLPANMTTQEADTFAKNLGKYAFSPVKTDAMGNADATELAQKSVAKDLFNYVRGMSDNQPGLNEAVQQIKNDPELASKISSYTQGIEDPQVRQAVEQKMLNDVQKANGIGDLRSAQADAVDMSKLGDRVSFHNEQNTYTKGAVNRSQPLQVDAGPSVLDHAANTVAGAKGGPVGMTAGLVKSLHDSGMTPKVVKGIGNIMQKTAAINVAGKELSPIAMVNTAQSNIPNIAAASVPGQSAIPSQQGNTMQGQPVNPVNDLYNTINLDLLAGAGVGSNAGSYISAAQALAPQVQKNQMAGDVIANLLPSYNNAGGAQGLGGGLLSRITGMIPGTAANTYQNEQQAAATQLAAALGITPQAAMAMLPSLMNNPNVAQQQLQGTGSVLNSLTAGQ